MKQILGAVRRADEKFGLINDGDRIAVGLSGGKDSLCLLSALCRYEQFMKKRIKLYAVTVDLGFGSDFSALRTFCDGLNVPYTILESGIGPLVFEQRREKNPCSLCAKLRRGALNNAAVRLGCNKTALGHNREDAVETLMMSLFFESRLHTFSPATYLSRTGLTVIRPLVTCPEAALRRAAEKYNMPVLTSDCPAAGKTQRQQVKELLETLQKKYRGLNSRLLSALMNDEQYGLWDRVGRPEAFPD